MTDSEERKATEEPQTAERDALLFGEVEDAIAYLQSLAEKAKNSEENPEEIERITQSALDTIGTLQQVYGWLNDSVRKLTDESTLKKHQINDPVFLQFIKIVVDRFGNYMQRTADAIEEIQQIWNIPRITIKDAPQFPVPLDKANRNIWNLLKPDKEETGQIHLDIITTSHSRRKPGNDAIIQYSIIFGELDDQITKRLTPFDKRVHEAVAALYKAGNHIMTITQIHKMMGNKGQPAPHQIERINNSLDKMRAAIITLDNRSEARMNKGYPQLVYDGCLLEFRRVRCYINNRLTDAAIEVLAKPILIKMAEDRRQITEIPRELLESPLSKTDANLMLDDYLIAEIGHMKNNPEFSKKMLLSTIYERCQITRRDERSRAPERIKKYLDHYQKCEWIKGYKMENDSLKIQL